MKIGLVSLGCAKNLVDSEMVLALFRESGFDIVVDPRQADVIVINTCGFIESAKSESIDNILEMAKYKKKLVVIGCLVERYIDDLKKEIPEVDLWIPIRQYPMMQALINGLFETPAVSVDLSPYRRFRGTPWYSAYLKISEGCNNRCTYCAIPLIRGNFHSRPLDELLHEARILAHDGVKEVVVISQDTTRYGTDLKEPTSIVALLKELLKIETFAYIRLLYLYPDELTDALIDLIAAEPRLTPYFDLPIQHASTQVLKAMHRRGDQAFLGALLEKIRSRVPHAIVRTTLIVGFPGETDEDFKELCAFVEKNQFDHLGVFTYSREEGTASFDFPDQVPSKTKQTRYRQLMEIQRGIAHRLNKKRIGEVMTGLVTGYDRNTGKYTLRSGFNAPDEIDGKIFFTSDRPLKAGDLAIVRITGAFVYDLEGIAISAESGS